MAYIDVIPLADAKTYLRVSDSASDAEITRMISSSLSYLERHTNIMVYSRNKTYPLPDDCIRIYDYPITAVVKGIDKAGADVTLTFETNYDQELKEGYTLYENIDVSAKQLVLTVGHASVSSVPTELIDAALEMIDFWYYKNDGKANITLVPESVQAVIHTLRRFIM